MKKFIAFAFSCLLFCQLSAQTSLYGKVTTADTGEELIGANIQIKKNGVLVTGVSTDFSGNYNVYVDAGTYDVEVSFLGYPNKLIQGVVVKPGQANRLDIAMAEPKGILMDEITVTEYKVPLIEIDNTSMGQTITMNDVRNLPTRNVNGLASKSAGLSQKSKGSNITVRGSRADATDYYIDGVRVKGTGSMIPYSEIDQLVILNSGTPAKYGDDAFYKPFQMRIINDDLPAKFRLEEGFDFSNESYEAIHENKFISPQEQAFSTFSIDVDHASYSNMRRFINSNQTPPADAVRIEEMINYFNYDYPQPETDVPFSITLELGDCPWNQKNKLLHIGLKGQNINLEKAAPNNLVFLIDVSGSMRSPFKLELLKPAFKLLVEQLRAEDQVAIVTYAGNAGLVLPSTSAADKQTIIDAIEHLRAGGSTAGAQGIELAYMIALENFIEDGNNRVILATDGDFNVGISDRNSLLDFIGEKRKSGIYLTALGFGYGNLKDNILEGLADKGNGNYAYIDNLSEARKVFGSDLTGTLYTIAKDVKIQVVFDHNSLVAYRLIGYENRLLEKEDFEDDKKDAGELGAGHTVTAIYELALRNDPADSLALVKLRYKLPKEEQSRFISKTVGKEDAESHATSDNFRFSAAVAGFGLLLRNSKFKGDVDCKMILELAESAKGNDEFGYREEFVELVSKYRDMNALSAK